MFRVVFRQAKVEFCVKVLRGVYADFQPPGRDVVAKLQDTLLNLPRIAGFSDVIGERLRILAAGFLRVCP